MVSGISKLNSDLIRPLTSLFKRYSLMFLTVLISIGLSPRHAQAQSTEQQFHDLFVTAGYASAFGAALGAAALSFKSQPERHLRYVAIGASLGFIGGSFLGTYIIFSPIFTAETPSKSPQLSSTTYSKKSTILLQPSLNLTTRKFESLQGTWTLASF